MFHNLDYINMTIFYNAEKNGFYIDGIHSTIPPGSVEITPEDHHRLISSQTTLTRIESDENGYPRLVQIPVDKEASDRRLAQSYLDTTDWYVVRFMETGTAIPDDVSIKRTECRVVLSS